MIEIYLRFLISCIISRLWCGTDSWNPSSCMEYKDLFILHSQYHGCWWPGDVEELVHQWSWYWYNDVIMCAMASQITSIAIVYSTIHSDVDQRKHQSSVLLAYAHSPVTGESPHKGPVTRKMFPFDNVIMYSGLGTNRISPWGASHISMG